MISDQSPVIIGSKPITPKSWSVIQSVGGDNRHESNFYLGNALLSSNPTSI